MDRPSELPPPAATGALKAGVSPKVIDRARRRRVLPPDLAHALTNNDREAAEQAASFLIGEGWEAESDDEKARRSQIPSQAA
jgi:hypothetical protein